MNNAIVSACVNIFTLKTTRWVAIFSAGSARKIARGEWHLQDWRGNAFHRLLCGLDEQRTDGTPRHIDDSFSPWSNR